MPFNLTTTLATPAISSMEPVVNQYGLYSLTVTLENKTAGDDFLQAAIRQYALTNSETIKEDLYNSYLSFYAVPALEVGVGALTKLGAETSANVISKRVALSALTQSQSGSALYKSFSVEGLPAGRQYKVGFELVLNGVAQPDWVAPTESVTTGGLSVAPPTVSLLVEEDGDTIKVTIDTADITETANFLLEVVDSTKADMPELSYGDAVVISSKFAFDATSKPTFTYSPATNGLRKYVNYDIRIRARKEVLDQPDSASDAVVATVQPFTLPWLRDFVNQTVIKGKQIEDSLVTDLAQKILSNAQTRDTLRTALNTGSYSNVAEVVYNLSRDVAVTEFKAMGAKFSTVREQLRRVALYAEIDGSYGELLDLADPELNEAFMFVTKQGYAGDTPTSYYSWLDKAFHLGPVVEAGVIAKDKYFVTVRGPVYRDRAEIMFV